MIDISLFGVDDATLDILNTMDANNDGILSGNEIDAASQNDINAIQQNADTNGEWDVIRQITLHRGEYHSKNQQVKSMELGGGGQFQQMVDRLMSVNSMSQSDAEKVAASISKLK